LQIVHRMLSTCATATESAKALEYNASATRCTEQGYVAGLIVQVCARAGQVGRSLGVEPRDSAQTRTVTPAEEYAGVLRARDRRKLTGVGNAYRIFNFVAALTAPLDHLNEVLMDSRVAHVQADCYAVLTPVELAATSASTSSAAVPWGLDRIDSRTGLDGRFDAGEQRGWNSTIYIADTGVRISHRDFGGRAVRGWSAYCNDEDDTCGAVGVDGGVITAGHSGCNSHGTHVASTAAGTQFGVAKAATIVAVQALNCYGGGTTSGIIGAIRWSMEDAITMGRERTSVISLSLTSNLGSIDKAAVVEAHNAGLVVVAAAGNAAYDQCASLPTCPQPCARCDGPKTD